MSLTASFSKLGLLLILSSIPAAGQSPDALEPTRGKVFDAIEIRPGVMMRVEKATYGQVSEIRLERFSGADSTIRLGEKIDAYLVKDLIDELVPIEDRGVQGEFFGLTLLTGLGWSANFDYELVSITMHGGIDVGRFIDQTKCQNEETKTNPLHRSEVKRNRTNPFPSAEVIRIKWKNM